MKATVKWLKEYVDFDLSPAELGEMLTMAGLEVEGISYLAPAGVVAARIDDIAAHPDADRLSICAVSDGRDTREIVCGAQNMKPGDIAALALPGTELPASAKFPDGLKIRRSKIRGRESAGMLCSEDELGISAEISDGIMILPSSVPAGTPLAEVAGIEDVALEIAVTPNRPDCLSIIGLAREIAAATGSSLKIPPEIRGDAETEDGSVSPNNNLSVSVSVENTAACPQYAYAVVSDVKVGRSPLWIRARLSACGFKPVSNVVDITNLVLLEFGQPLHAFDFDRIQGGRLTVRNALSGESLRALDSVSYNLSCEDIVIADASAPVAVAGVMGGEFSAAGPATKNVVIEAARFNPSLIRRTSKRLKLSSESSYRFERGVDPEIARAALKRAVSLINSAAGGRAAGEITEIRAPRKKPHEVEISLAKTWKTLGIKSDRQKIETLLKSLGFEISRSGTGALALKVPTFRHDISRPADVVEEIARLVGYNSIPEAEPRVTMVSRRPDPAFEADNLIKKVFVINGFSEAVNYGFDSPSNLREFHAEDFVELLNPISAEISVMRSTLLAGLMRNVKLNISRQNRDVRLFELGRIFSPKPGGLPKEKRMFAAVATEGSGQGIWGARAFDFFDMKGFVESAIAALPGGDEILSEVNFRAGSDRKYLHPGKSATVVFKDKTLLGHIGELHPETARAFGAGRVAAAEISLENLYSCARQTDEPRLRPLPKFPSVRRDLAFVVDKNLEIGSIISGVRQASPLVEKAWIFDLFEDESIGADKKSVGISMLLRSAEKTLTDEQANAACEKAERFAASRFGAQVRRLPAEK